MADSPHPTSIPAAEPEPELEQLALSSKLISSDQAPSYPKPASPVVVKDSIPTSTGASNSSFSADHTYGPTNPVATSEATTSDQAMEASLQETIRTDNDSHEGEDDMDIDMEDVYAPDPAKLAPESPNPNQDLPAVQGDSAILADQIPVRDDGQDPLGQLPNDQHSTALENNDDYEPPETTPPINSPIESPPFSPAPPESVPDLEDFAYDAPALGHAVQESHSIGVDGSVPHLIEVMHLEWLVL